MSWTPRKPADLSDEDIIDTIVDGYIEGVEITELFDMDMSLEQYIRVARITHVLIQNTGLFALAVAARRLERGCGECKDKDHQSCPCNAQLN